MSIVKGLIEAEKQRVRNTVNLVASENYPSKAVLNALKSPFIYKYAEGYPGGRYYGGCSIVDRLENYAKELACDVFECDYANVQPHSGTQANFAVYKALLHPGAKVLALDLDHGGHLSHGSPYNLSGEVYQFIHYRIDFDENGKQYIDYDDLEELATKPGIEPDLIVVGGSSLFAEIDWHRMRQIADASKAFLMADVAHVAGFIASGFMPNPIEWVDVMTTTTQKTLRGPRGGLILSHSEFSKELDKAVFPGTQGGPHMNTVAAKAVALEEAQTSAFEDYMEAVALATKAACHTFGYYKCPLIYGEGAPHMLILNTAEAFGLTGLEAQLALERNGIIVNKQMIPNDPNPPRVTSGIRIGMAAWVTRARANNLSHIAPTMANLIKRCLSGTNVLHDVQMILRDYPKIHR